MSDITTVDANLFGPALFPYSQATVAAGLVFVAGQVALDDENNVIAPNDAYEQTLATLDRVERVLAEVGGQLDDLLSATVFVPDLKYLPDFNRAWAERFGDYKPARATLVAGLLIEGLVVEVQSIAVSRG